MIKNKTVKGAILMSLACVCFSIAGVLFKLISWGAMSSNAVRLFIAAGMFFAYIKIRHRKIVVNKNVLLGALFLLLTTNLFALSNKNTTAANAIILQFTAPIFLILYTWLAKHKKPQKQETLACIFVFAGLILFFFDSLSTGHYLGDFFGLLSGIAYAGVFLFNTKENSDAASAVLIAYTVGGFIGIPFIFAERDFSLRTILLLLALGVVQIGLGYLFFTMSLDYLPALPASLMSGLEPILNPILVAVFYPEEHLTVFALLGAAVVLVTIVAYNVAKALKDSKIPVKTA